MIRHDAAVGAAAHDNVTAALARDDETEAFQSSYGVATGDNRKLRHCETLQTMSASGDQHS